MRTVTVKCASCGDPVEVSGRNGTNSKHKFFCQKDACQDAKREHLKAMKKAYKEPGYVPSYSKRPWRVNRVEQENKKRYWCVDCGHLIEGPNRIRCPGCLSRKSRTVYCEILDYAGLAGGQWTPARHGL